MKCKICEDNGLPNICKGCGKKSYEPLVPQVDEVDLDFKIPIYYKQNIWVSSKIVRADNEYTGQVLNYLDTLVGQVRQGKKINRSYGFLLPVQHGKKTAMFTIMQEYLAHGYTVAPPIDVVSLALIQNNYSLKRKDAEETWYRLVNSDLVCVFGVDFAARYQTMKLYTNLCTIRGLRGLPTLLFDTNGKADLQSKFVADVIHSDLKSGCNLSNPIILDGVTPVTKKKKRG